MEDNQYLVYALHGIDIHKRRSIENAEKTDLYDRKDVFAFQIWFDSLKEEIKNTPPGGFFEELVVIQNQSTRVIKKVRYRGKRNKEPNELFSITIQEQ